MRFDVDHVQAALRDAARTGVALTYSEALATLGHRFTRPLMRQLCTVLAEVDARVRGRGEPDLAVLVVRQSDGLPGQGWWLAERGYVGPWQGPTARAHVTALQGRAFRYWSASGTISRLQ